MCRKVGPCYEFANPRNPFQVQKRLLDFKEKMTAMRSNIAKPFRHLSRIACIQQCALSSQKTFYDSQSGGFIAVPGSSGLRVHDSLFAARGEIDQTKTSLSNTELVEYMRKASALGVTSLSLPLVTDRTDFQRSMATSVEYLRRNRSKLPLIVAAQVWNKDHAAILCELAAQSPVTKEVLVAEFLSDSSMGDSIRDISASGITTRTNLFINIDPLLKGGEYSQDLKSVIEVGEGMARLCDQGLKVINLALCCSSSAVNATTGKLTFLPHE